MARPRGPMAFAAVFCLLHLLASAVSEDSVDGLDDNLMDRVLERYRLYKDTGSREVHGEFFSSLLQLSEGVRSELDQGWRFGETTLGDFAFVRDGETKSFINRYGDVWGAKAEGYFMGGDVPNCAANSTAGEAGGQEEAQTNAAPQDYGCEVGSLEEHPKGQGDVCRSAGEEYSCPIGCSKTEDGAKPFCVWEGNTECHNTASMSLYPDASGEFNKQSKEDAASRCDQLGAHLCTQDETTQHWGSFVAARDETNFYGWVADGDGCILNGLQSTDDAPKHACGYIETTTYNALCCREPKPLRPEKQEAVTSISVGRWSVSVDEQGDLLFKRGDQVAARISASGKVWGKTEQNYLKPSVAQAVPLLPSTMNLKLGSFVEIGDWVMGEAMGTGDFAFYKANQLMSVITKGAEWWSAGMCGVFESKGHAARDPGPIQYPVSTTTVDCAVSLWSDWTDCSQSCGGGHQSRSRSVLTEQGNGGAACPELEENRRCNAQGCPRDCQVTEWSGWSKCSLECGGGYSHRERNVSSYPSSRGRPCPDVKESKTCNNEVCGADMCKSGAGSFVVDLSRKERMIMFAGENWVEYNSEESTLIQKVRKISEGGSMFASLPAPFAKQINAAVNAPDGKNVYLFSSGLDEEDTERSQWLLFDPLNAETLRGPYDMEQGTFSSLPAPFNHTISAAVNRGGPDMNEAYFFSGSQWVLFDMKNNAVVEGPREINTGSSLNLPAPFNQRIDSAMPDQGDLAVLFSGDEWLVWDLDTRAVSSGPFMLGVHPRFKPLVEELKLCTGYDLQSLGEYYSKLHQIVPTPVGAAATLTGSAGDHGYVDANQREEVRFNKPHGVVNLGGDVAYVVDSGNNAVRKVNLTTGATVTIAGGSTVNGFQDGVGSNARFSAPTGMTGVRVDPTEQAKGGDLLYVADTMNHAIRRLWVEDGQSEAEVETMAGGGQTRCEQCDPSGAGQLDCKSCCNCEYEAMGFRDDNAGQYSLFAEPQGVAIAYDPNSNSLKGRNEVVYVADTKNHAIRRLVKAPGQRHAEVVTVAGGQKAPPSTLAYAQLSVPYQWGRGLGSVGCLDGGGSEAMFNSPRDIALVKQENNHVLYVADTENNRVARVAVALQMVSGEPKITVPILSVTAEKESLNSGVVANSVDPGTEFLWDPKLQSWTDPSGCLPGASVCPREQVDVPISIVLTLGGLFHVNSMYFEWSHGGAKDYQVAFSQDGKSWATAMTKHGLSKRATEEASVPLKAQKHKTSFIRIGITALNEHSWQIPVIRVTGQMLDPTLPSLPEVLPEVSNSSCVDLGWGAEGDTVCSSARIKDNECLPEEESTVTYEEAVTTCKAAGARLCTIDEIQQQFNNTGCEIDEKRVWSSTACGCGAQLSQRSRIDSDDPMASMPRVCSPIDQKLSVQCCADEPAKLVKELGEDLMDDGDGMIEVESTQDLKRIRFTNGTGSAAADSVCAFPFVVQGEAFNNCTMLVDGDKEPGEHGWCPVQQDHTVTINDAQDVLTNANPTQKMTNGILMVTADTKWGVCTEPGYAPSECIMSPWTGWAQCSMICGGGTKSRTRKVLSKSGQNPICAETEELTTCNEHECGFVETIAGGTVSGSKVGLGFRESPLNALWIQRSPERSPDLHYKPAAIDVVEHENGYHAVFIAGKETKRADNVEYIRRIDVTHFTPQDKGGAGAPTNCTDLSRYSADPTSLPVEAAECRIFTSGDGFFAARVGAIELDEEDVGSRFNGATALSAESVDSLLVASSTSSLLTRLDLSEQIRCQSWMTEGLRQWDVSTDGMPHRSSPVKLQLSSLSGSSSQWQLDVTRVVGEFKSLGVSDNYQANRVGDPYTWQKNMMCASEIRKGHSDPTKPVQKTKCCVAKQAEQIPPPEECPMPIQEACASKYKIAMQDYEYALQIIARDLKLGEGIHV